MHVCTDERRSSNVEKSSPCGWGTVGHHYFRCKSRWQPGPNCRLPLTVSIRRHTHAHNTSCPTMFADRKASFKQPPRHVIDKALSQEARRNKVCRYQIMRTPWPAHATARQALEEQKRVRHILVASGSAIQRISYI